jgi:serine/threonine protein kinase
MEPSPHARVDQEDRFPPERQESAEGGRQHLESCANDEHPTVLSPGPPPERRHTTRPWPSIPGYEILGELGRGGMGVVYKARQTAHQRLVALKLLLGGGQASAHRRARFRTEAEAAGRSQHPNIAEVYTVGEHDGLLFYAMELVEGESLAKYLAGRPQSAAASARLAETVARAVHHAHQQGVIHRDLKPENVLLSFCGGSQNCGAPPPTPSCDRPLNEGVPKITDFGLAKCLDAAHGQTHSGDLVGTPAYMAPEQAAGKTREIGSCTDVYALGAILYEMLTGRPPFQAETVVETLRQVIDEEPVPPGRLRTRLPRDLERICLKCLAKDPHARYASALDLAEDLRRYLHDQPVQARPPSPLARLWGWSRRNPFPASLLLAITLGSAAGLWHLSRLSQSLVRSAALESAAQQAETLDELNKYYGRVASHFKHVGVHASADWQRDPRAVPLPATLTIELGQQISARAESGVQVRLYSDHPFLSRKDGGPRDDFEREALLRLREDPEQPYYRFEEFRGRPSLRYAIARRMEAACVDCHNTHPDSTKRDWRAGDVRGVQEIIRPLDRDAARIQEGLRGTFLLVAAVASSLLLLCGLLLVLGRRRRQCRGEPGT